MKKGKYNLSKSAMDKLMDNLTKIATEEADDSVTGLLEAQITTSFVKTMTKVKGLEDVIARNDTLSKTYMGLLSMYGFESMYDMYLYAKSCDIIPEELMKRKDYSKLVPVKRKIVRNGKEQEITVYEDPNADKGSQSNESGRDTSAAHVPHARELKGKVHGDNEHANPKEIAKLKQAAKGMSSGQEFQDSDYYLELKGPDGNLHGIVGYSEDGDYMVMDFYKTDGVVPGIAARGFAQLIQLAVGRGLGVKAPDNPQARPVYIQFGLEQGEEGNMWSAEADHLEEVFGESGNPSE
ncbi:hypothetical protein P59_053 [Bacillus phage P59]|nr:hypothetical protein P59_053 [Bacillus phage P59]